MRLFWVICRWVLAIIVGAVISTYGWIWVRALFVRGMIDILISISGTNHNLLFVLLCLQELVFTFLGSALGALAAVFINRKTRPFLTAYLTVFVGLLILASGFLFYCSYSILTNIFVACAVVGFLAGGTLAGYLGRRLSKAEPPTPVETELGK